jgi:hypothetical protein
VKTFKQIDINAGWDVCDANGNKIGSINDVRDSYLVVSKGTLFPKDIFVPMNAVQRVDQNEHRVYLNVDKNAIEAMGWDDPKNIPAPGGFKSDTTSDGQYDQTYAGTRGDYDASGGFETTTPSGLGDTTREPAGTGAMRTQRTGYGDEDASTH